MFDNVGRNLDEEANKRRAASAFLMVLTGGITATVFLVAGAFAVKEVVTENFLDDAEMVELEVEEEMEEEAPPPPPPPPGPEVEEEEEEEDEEEPEPDVEEMIEDVQDLDEDIDDSELEQPETSGHPEGQEGGEEGGVPGGVVGGTPGGTGDTFTTHVTTEPLKLKLPIEPVMPKQAEETLPVGQYLCRVRFFVDDRGKPSRIEFLSCPKVFHEATEAAAMKTRFYPYKENGERKSATFIISYRYKIKA